jgi:type IV fimbrial biogenesis protein FimT
MADMAVRSGQRASGFTLPELAVVLGVAAVVLAVAVPDLRDLLQRQRLRAAAADLFGAVNLARAQALARGHKVKLVPRDPQGIDWRTGWTVFADGDGDGLRGPGDEVIAEHGPLAPGIRIAFAFTQPAPPYYIAYNGAGRGCLDANGAAARWGTLTLSLAGSEGSEGGGVRRITINMLGRARLCDPARDAACTGPPAPDDP